MRRLRDVKQTQEAKMNVVQELKRFAPEGAQLEDMVVLAALGKIVKAEFEHRNIPSPAWLDDANRRLALAIEQETRDAKLLRLRELKAQKEQFMSREEKKNRTEQEIAELEAQLQGVK